MPSIAPRVFIVLILISFLFLGCGSGGDKSDAGPSTNTDNSVVQNEVPSDRLEDLKLLIRIPYDAEDAVWKVEGSSSKLTAVLIFTAEDTKALLFELRKGGDGADAELALESWFPEELIAKAEMSGDAELRGKAYPAEQFFMDRYNTGRVIHIEETEIFILELSPSD
jgi:hypothetical protein